MSAEIPAPVIAGVDGSAESLTAARYAAWEADRRQLPLHLVHGLVYPPAYGYAIPPSGEFLRAVAEDAKGLLRGVEDTLRKEYPALEIDRRVIVGSPGGVLVDESKSASLVVLGTRGRGGFARLLTGSVSSQVATHAYGPVVVVRAQPDDGEPVPGSGPVTVGVDGSSGTAAVVAFAAGEAALRKVPLRLVHVWRTAWDSVFPLMVEPTIDDTALREAAGRIMAEAVAGLPRAYPDLVIEQRIVGGVSPAYDLMREAAGSSLLVVGSHGHGAVTSTLLGSVSHAVLHHARQSVVLVRVHESP